MAEKMHMGKMFTSNPLRKFRWMIEVTGGENVQHYVKTFARPNMDFEETELNFRHEKMWIAGKMTWGDISMTVLDVEDEDPFYQWVKTVYDLDQKAPGQTGDEVGDQFALMGRDYDDTVEKRYKRSVKLKMLNGRGELIETWFLQNCWPRGVNFGDLDYSSSDTCDIEVTMRFDRATRTREKVQ